MHVYSMLQINGVLLVDHHLDRSFTRMVLNELLPEIYSIAVSTEIAVAVICNTHALLRIVEFICP